MADIEKGSYFEIAPAATTLQQQNELRITLVARQITDGEEQNQQVVVPRSSNPTSFGQITAADWTVVDSLDLDANLIGNLLGMHVQSSMAGQRCCAYFDLVFKNGRFKGSTLKILASFDDGNYETDGQWAIVGGTGEFSFAQGAIHYAGGTGLSDHDAWREIQMRVFYTPIKADD